ncbi:hypothetical protein D3C81_1387500 [compost metagenome]
MAAETGVHEVAEDAAVQAAEVVAHGHVTELEVECRGEQGALIAQFSQAGVEAAVVFLDRQAVAHQVFRGAVAAAVVDRQLDLAAVVQAVQLAQIKLHAQLEVLRVTRRAVQAAIGVVGGFAAVVASELDALFVELVAQAAPVAGQGVAGHQVVGQGCGAGQGQEQGRGDARSGGHCGVFLGGR